MSEFREITFLSPLSESHFPDKIPSKLPGTPNGSSPKFSRRNVVTIFFIPRLRRP